MSGRFEEVKQLLMKHDYVTSVRQTGDGCIVTYPHPKLLYGAEDIPRLIECFAIQRGKKPGFWVSTTFDKQDQGERFIDVPEYAMRLYIVCEIAACNFQIPLDPSLLFFFDEGGQEREGIESIIKKPESEKEAGMEGFLFKLVMEARNDGFPQKYEDVAETHKVKEGYVMIRKFYD